MTVIAISGDHLIAVTLGHLHADDDGFLADVEVAEAADQPHAIHLTGFLFETADQEHVAERQEFFVLVKLGVRSGLRRGLGGGPRSLASGSSSLVWATAISVLETSRVPSLSRNRLMAEVGAQQVVPAHNLLTEKIFWHGRG